jgi:hypothetical protein
MFVAAAAGARVAKHGGRSVSSSSGSADALEALCDSGDIKIFRAQRGGQWLNLYWPTDQKTGEHEMAKQTGATTLMKCILQHGPITGAELAKQTGILPRNVENVLLRAKADYHTRTKFLPEVGRPVKHYLTGYQAEEWDAKLQDMAHESGHVMSTPPAVSSAKQSEAEIPESESAEAMPEPDLALLASANRMLSERLDGVAHVLRGCGLPALENIDGSGDLQMHAAALAGAYYMARCEIHDLKNDVCAANLIFSQLAETLKVEKPEQIPDALDELTHALATRAMVNSPADRGELILVLIDSSELVEFEELDQSDTAHAQQRAIQTIEQGHAARALVVRFIGEARRHVAWMDAA